MAVPAQARLALRQQFWPTWPQGWHAPAAHSPPLHTVPSATLPEGTQTWVPPVQDVTPVWHALPVEHGRPGVHETQPPAELHTRFVPQLVPAGTLVPASTHVEAPFAHDVLPTWHRLSGVQSALAAHAVQVPVLHTMLVPHVVPFGRLVPRSVHPSVPLAHVVVPL